MIEKLTKEQTDQIPEFVDKYVKIGLCTDGIDPDAARDYAKRLYKFLGRRAPSEVVIAAGPTDAWEHVCGSSKDLSQIKSQTETQVESQTTSQIWSQFWLQVESQLRLESSIWSQILSRIVLPIWSRTGSQGSLQVYSQIKSKIPSFICPHLTGQFQASWIAQIRFLEHIGVSSLPDAFVVEDQLRFGFVYPLRDVCVISDRMSDVHQNEKGLNRKDEAALSYPDGTEVWAVDGVRTPKPLSEREIWDNAIEQTLKEFERDRLEDEELVDFDPVR